MTDSLASFAAFVADDPLFLAADLAAFAARAGLDDAALAAHLGGRPEALNDLRVCRAPRPEAADFRADIVAVAKRFGFDANALAQAVSGVRAVRRLRAGASGRAGGFLLAARDAES